MMKGDFLNILSKNSPGVYPTLLKKADAALLLEGTTDILDDYRKLEVHNYINQQWRNWLFNI
jgi:hypothetical protein